MRYGLVGTGFWAREVHADTLAQGPDTDLVGVWGRDATKAAELADSYGASVYDDPGAMFADVDAVAFAVPPDVQARLAVEAATAGCHLLLEKPVALDAAGAGEVADAAAANGVASVVFFKLRFVPAVETWLDEVRGQGGWWGARAWMLASLLQPDSPFGSSPWRREHGGLWDIGPHALSMLLPVLGPVGAVTGVRGPKDSVQLALKHAEGGTSSLLLSLDAPSAATGSEISVFGEHGWSEAPSDRGADPATLYRSATAALARAASTGEPHPCDVRFGREVVEVLARAQDAMS